MKLDPKVTQAIQDWLNTPEESRSILAGADLLLSLNRNRALYNSIVRKPSQLASKLEYELKKYLRIRLDDMAAADVARMDNRVMAAVSQSYPEIVVSADAEILPTENRRGKRPDHDSLPAHIRELWDSNGERFKKLVITFNELKAMSNLEPCDRYEKLVILDELDKKIRKNMQLYDEYVTGSEPVSAPELSPEVKAENTRLINNSRKTLSKYRHVYLSSSDTEKRAVALSKMQTAVNVIVSCGGTFGKDTIAELASFGISFVQ